jgi:anti-sigma factor RsiW
MSAPVLTEEELHAFIDGELPPARAAEVARILAADRHLAGRAAAFRLDRDRLAAATAAITGAPLPAAWLRRIEAAVEPAGAKVLPFPVRKRAARPVFAWAAAACLAFILALGVVQFARQGPGDTILAEAERAGRGGLTPAAHFAGTALPGPEAVRALLSQATGLKLRAPDLRRLGWRLVSVDTYRGAAGLHYVNDRAASLSVYVRRSAGAPRFDILRRGDTRICVWQDEVVGAVMMGNLSAGQMMRVAGAAYADLDL